MCSSTWYAVRCVRMRRLTDSSSTDGREWPDDDDEATLVTVGDVWSREQPLYLVFRISSSGAIRPARAAGRVHIEVRVVTTAQLVGIGGGTPPAGDRR